MFEKSKFRSSVVKVLVNMKSCEYLIINKFVYFTESDQWDFILQVFEFMLQ